MTKDSVLTEKQLVLFDLGGELYAVDIGAVYEIIRMQPITKVPKAPFFVEGIINLRGKVIPVVDMRKRFGLTNLEQTKDNRIMVVDSGGQSVGIIVDAVTEVLRIASESVEPPSSIITTSASDYMLGIAKRDGDMIVLLDLDRVLTKEAVASSLNQTDDEYLVEEKQIPEPAMKPMAVKAKTTIQSSSKVKSQPKEKEKVAVGATAS
jgi:purine-binding chemotaxis protein CheW